MRKLVTIFKQILKRQDNLDRTPSIIKREQHTISRSHISKAALKVLYRLYNAGFASYLVGGSVRDLLLGLSPKDFDIATDAHPEQIQKLFKNSFIIGRRFKLVHVRFGSEIIEVATFRDNKAQDSRRVETQHGFLLRDNVYGTLEDDVFRRDFTVNALYYNIADFSIIDYVQAMEDLKRRYIRVIGEPAARYREDPGRMIRAILLAGKLDFIIEPTSLESIKEHKELLAHIPPARLFDMLLKIFHSGKSFAIFQLLREYDVFSILFPVTSSSSNAYPTAFLDEALKNTDERIDRDKNINSAFLFSVIFWDPLQIQKKKFWQRGEMNEYQAIHAATTTIIKQQLKIIAIPKRFTSIMREIWSLQYNLEHAKTGRVFKVLHHPRFRAAYDFLVLRCQAQESPLQDLCQWWTAFQEGDAPTREKLIADRFAMPKKQRNKKKE
jgi:poly(A) polymerase